MKRRAFLFGGIVAAAVPAMALARGGRRGGGGRIGRRGSGGARAGGALATVIGLGFCAFIVKAFIDGRKKKPAQLRSQNNPASNHVFTTKAPQTRAVKKAVARHNNRNKHRSTLQKTHKREFE